MLTSPALRNDPHAGHTGPEPVRLTPFDGRITRPFYSLQTNHSGVSTILDLAKVEVPIDSPWLAKQNQG